MKKETKNKVMRGILDPIGTIGSALKKTYGRIKGKMKNYKKRNNGMPKVYTPKNVKPYMPNYTARKLKYATPKKEPGQTKLKEKNSTLKGLMSNYNKKGKL